MRSRRRRLRAPPRAGLIIVVRHDNHAGLGIEVPNLSRGRKSIHARHADIHQHHIRLPLGVFCQGIRAVCAIVKNESRRGQRGKI